MLEVEDEKTRLYIVGRIFYGDCVTVGTEEQGLAYTVGACIVNHENKILSLGYNGMPTGCCDDDMLGKEAVKTL